MQLRRGDLIVLRTDESDVIFLVVTGKTREVRQTAESRDAREDRICLHPESATKPIDTTA